MSAQWPSAVSTSANLYTAVNNLSTTLSGNINNSVTTIGLTSTTGFPTAGGVTIDNEVIFYTGISGSNLTGCVRGSDGTSAASHNSGVPVGATILAIHINALTAEVIALETDLHSRLGFGSSTVVSMAAGSAATPTLNFGDTGTGLYKNATNVLGLTSNGADTATFGAYVVSKQSGFAAQNGSVGSPTYSFDSQLTMGMYRIGSSDLGFSTNGILQLEINTSNVILNLPLLIPGTSNQIVLGATRTVTITAPTPATSSRTWTLPDLATSPTFAALEGTQTFSGAKTFSAVAAFSSGSAATPSIVWSASTTDGFYRIGSGETGLASGGNLQADFGPFGNSDDTQYNLLKLLSSATTGYLKTGIYSTTTVTTAKQIYGDGIGDGGIIIVHGNDGTNKFVDIILSSYDNSTPTVIASHTAVGSPAARTYSMSANATVKVAMASGTYSIRAIGIGVSAR